MILNLFAVVRTDKVFSLYPFNLVSRFRGEMKLLNLFCFISIINICFNIWVFLNFLLTPGLTTGSNLKMNTYSTNLNRGKHYSRNYSNPISKHSYCFKCKRVLLFLFWANFNWIYVFHPTKRRCYSSWFAGKGCYRAGRNTRVWCCIYASHNINIRTKWMVIVSGPWAWTRLDLYEPWTGRYVNACASIPTDECLQC